MMLLCGSTRHPTSWQLVNMILLLAMSLAIVGGQELVLDRKSYVPFPSNAHELLLQEIAAIDPPLALDVVTSVAHPDQSYILWEKLKGPVRRTHNQNQIVHVSPHFHVTNGILLGCRVLQRDEDTNTEVEEEVLPAPSHCSTACTNHGRYCVVPHEESPASPANVRGKMFVEETLRRICFAELYHGSDLRFWEYVEYFYSYDCDNAEDMTACALRVLDEVPRADYLAIENCMHATGGLEADNENVHLKAEMDKQTGHFPYASQEVPFFKFDEQKYTGVMGVAPIFQWMCAIFEDKTSVTPVACDFCSQCNDVLSCLWFLNCDGTPFDVAAYLDTTAPVVTPMTTIPEPSLTSIPITAPPTTGEPATAPPTTPPTGDLVTAPPTTTEATSPPSPRPTSQDAIPDTVNNDPKVGPPFVEYGIPILIAFGAFAMYFFFSWYCKSPDKRRRRNRRASTAEDYMNDMMDASYGENLAASSRIDSDRSDRHFEDIGLDESYVYPDSSYADFSRRRANFNDSYVEEEDDFDTVPAPSTAPPIGIFKVHQVE